MARVQLQKAQLPKATPVEKADVAVVTPPEAKKTETAPTAFVGTAAGRDNRLEGSPANSPPVAQREVFGADPNATRAQVRDVAQKFAHSLERALKSDPAWAWEEKFALEYVAKGGDGSNLTAENYQRALAFAHSLEPAIKTTPNWAWEADIAVRCLKGGGDGSKLTKAAYQEALSFAEKLPVSSKTSPAWAWDAKYALDLLLNG